MENRSLTFWEVVLAVVLGLMFFGWIKDLKPDPAIMSGLAPLFWIGVIVYIVGSVIVSSWHQRREQKERDRKELEFVRSHGFESWAEYMVVHGEGEDTRRSWEKKAAEEKKEREGKSA